MKVQLLNYTTNALEILLDTKEVRMGGKRAADMTADEQAAHFAYMLDTIKSPFEFVDYIFRVEGVSRNFSHQFVRTRTNCYQEKTGRANDLSGDSVIVPGAIQDSPHAQRLFKVAADLSMDAYRTLIDLGIERQDARAILPGNIETRVDVKVDLRSMHEMGKNRLCTRTAGEYQNVFREMRRLIIETHPWAASLIQPACIANGQCAFPRWGKDECQHWRPWMDKSNEIAALKLDFWAADIQVANPVAVDGVSMGVKEVE